MQLILASPRGFCAGVNRAITTLEQVVAKYPAPIFVYHEIVHNTWVVRHFQERGVRFVNTLEDVPDGACVMYSAHGVSPEIRAQSASKHLRVIDATCPLVAHIHAQARKFAAEGFQIVLIGHAGHDEIVGVMQEAPEVIHVICSKEEAEALVLPDTDKVAYLTQTTLSVEETAEIIAALQRRFPKIQHSKPDCICFATQNRQRAVRELVAQADVALIIGSANSSNSRRLQELAAKTRIPAHLIDGAEDLQAAWFQPEQTVLITAGASAPEAIVQQVVSQLQAQYGAAVTEAEICQESLTFKLPEI